MSILQYMKDKRFFLIFYLLLMTFVSMNFYLVLDLQSVLSNILYIQLTGITLVILYLIIGYFYRRQYYDDLAKIINREQEVFLSSLPKAQNAQQQLFTDVLGKVLQDHGKKLEKLYDEKRDQQEFILSWIHEIKLPISACRLLMENSEGKEVDMLVDKFEDEINRIEHYVEQALYYSRIDTFSKDYFIQDINIQEIIKQSVKKHAKLFINKGIRFNMNENILLVQSDSKWLGFIIDQIISNSLKYTNEGGCIQVRFEEDLKEKRVLIQDNGIGIKEEDIHRVFEKGFTGATGRSHAKSTGMGLYLTKQLSKKLGHNITIDSDEGHYTEVIIHFPKVRDYYLL